MAVLLLNGSTLYSAEILGGLPMEGALSAAEGSGRKERDSVLCVSNFLVAPSIFRNASDSTPEQERAET